MINEELIKRYIHRIFPQLIVLRKDDKETYFIDRDYSIYKIKEKGWYFKNVNDKYEDLEIGPITLEQSLSILCTKIFEGLLRDSHMRLWHDKSILD